MKLAALFFVAIFSSSGFAGLDSLTLNREISFTALGPMVVGDKSRYHVDTKRTLDKKPQVIVSKDNYRLVQVTEVDGSWTAVETMREKVQMDSGRTGQEFYEGHARLTKMDKNNLPESYSQCESKDRKLNSGPQHINLMTCATATVDVCAQMDKFATMNMDRLKEKMNACHDLAKFQGKLAELLEDGKYRVVSAANIKQLAEHYGKFVRPNPTVVDKILDDSKASSIEARTGFGFDPLLAEQDGKSISALLKACTTFKALNKRNVVSLPGDSTQSPVTQ